MRAATRAVREAIGRVGVVRAPGDDPDAALAACARWTARMPLTGLPTMPEEAEW